MNRTKIEQWVYSKYEEKRPGYTMRPTDGALLIETPSTIIPMRRGYDAIVAAQQGNPVGTERLETIAHSRREAIEAAEKEIHAIEHQLLETIRERNSMSDPTIKREKTIEIGVLQNRLSIASTTLQTIITPRRYKVVKDIMKLLLNYETKNESIIKMAIINSEPITLKERSIEKSAKKSEEKPTAEKTA